MNSFRKSLAFAFLFLVSNVHAGLLLGTADSVSPVTASGMLDGVNWTATTTATSPFLGINMGSGNWDLSTPLDTGALFLGTDNVNAGDTQTFTFDQPVSNIYFYVENFDSGSAANVVTDGVLSIIEATADITFTPTTTSSAVITNANTSFDGVGDMILMLSGPTSYVQFDYTGGEQANGVFYGFAKENLTASAVPEPSAFLFLLMCGSGAAYWRRNRINSVV